MSDVFVSPVGHPKSLPRSLQNSTQNFLLFSVVTSGSSRPRCTRNTNQCWRSWTEIRLERGTKLIHTRTSKGFIEGQCRREWYFIDAFPSRHHVKSIVDILCSFHFRKCWQIWVMPAINWRNSDRIWLTKRKRQRLILQTQHPRSRKRVHSLQWSLKRTFCRYLDVNAILHWQ